eukprot:486873_1
MGFVKVVKNKAYFKRYQVKYRRRRECKTDYKQRRKLIAQDKNKYSTPKYRFVVRITNRDIICQVFSSDLSHDECLASAYSHELKRYGVKVGLTNYAAAYCTGLLLARRVNKKFGLDEEHEGTEEVDGDFYLEEEGGAFKAFLDVGLARTTTGANIFGALKGACDGGLHIPHNSRRFPGSYREEGEEGRKVWEFSPEAHRARIFSEHVADYMRQVQEEGVEGAFEKQFGKYVEAGVGPDDLEQLYKDAHIAIRADPCIARAQTDRGYFKVDRTAAKKTEFVNKKHNKSKIGIKQRWNRVRQRYANILSA